MNKPEEQKRGGVAGKVWYVIERRKQNRCMEWQNRRWHEQEVKWYRQRTTNPIPLDHPCQVKENGGWKKTNSTQNHNQARPNVVQLEPARRRPRRRRRTVGGSGGRKAQRGGAAGKERRQQQVMAAAQCETRRKRRPMPAQPENHGRKPQCSRNHGNAERNPAAGAGREPAAKGAKKLAWRINPRKNEEEQACINGAWRNVRSRKVERQENAAEKVKAVYRRERKRSIGPSVQQNGAAAEKWRWHKTNGKQWLAALAATRGAQQAETPENLSETARII
jgi:hypothetical protein